MDEVIAYIREKAAVSRRHAKRGDPADRPTHEHTARVLDILADEIAGGIHTRDNR